MVHSGPKLILRQAQDKVWGWNGPSTLRFAFYFLLFHDILGQLFWQLAFGLLP
jgi:hypothetical protein